MKIAVLYVATLVVFLAIDSVGLRFLIRPVFEQDISHMLLEDFRLGPAIAFYAFYIACLIWFVSWPALSNRRSLAWVFGSGALLGAMAYGTYEFTNLATLRDWTWRMLATDLAWGTMLTGASATIGVAVARLFVSRLKA